MQGKVFDNGSEWNHAIKQGKCPLNQTMEEIKHCSKPET